MPGTRYRREEEHSSCWNPEDFDLPTYFTEDKYVVCTEGNSSVNRICSPTILEMPCFKSLLLHSHPLRLKTFLRPPNVLLHAPPLPQLPSKHHTPAHHLGSIHLLSVQFAESVFVEAAAFKLILEKAESVASAVEVREEGKVEAEKEADKEGLRVDDQECHG